MSERGAFDVYDFSESVACAQRDGHGSGISIGEVKECLAAWGTICEGYCDWEGWEGGFLVSLKDGRFAYITGWNDTSGWG